MVWGIIVANGNKMYTKKGGEGITSRQSRDRIEDNVVLALRTNAMLDGPAGKWKHRGSNEHSYRKEGFFQIPTPKGTDFYTPPVIVSIRY